MLFEGPYHSRLYSSQRIIKEITLMSKLDHPGVCKLFEVFMSPSDRTIREYISSVIIIITFRLILALIV